MKPQLQDRRPPRPPWWHSWVKTLLPIGRLIEIYKVICRYNKILIPRPAVLLWLLGLMVQVFCLWLLHELVLLCIDLFEVWALLARKYLELTL